MSAPVDHRLLLLQVAEWDERVEATELADMQRQLSTRAAALHRWVMPMLLGAVVLLGGVCLVAQVMIRLSPAG